MAQDHDMQIKKKNIVVITARGGETVKDLSQDTTLPVEI